MLNLLIGLPTMMACLVLQAAFTFWSVRFYTQQSGRMRPGRGLIANVRTLLIVMIIMMLGNCLQIVIWGALFIGLGEFSECRIYAAFLTRSKACRSIYHTL